MKLLRTAYGSMCGFAGGELDLSQVPPGLVTLAGPNWQGKTMFLELPLASFYREWASRTTGDIKYWADARDSWVETDFVVNDQTYRARVTIDGQQRKSNAVLLRWDGQWHPMNDGKVSSFDEAIATLVPPKNAMLCSQFSAQNRAGSLTEASKSARKDLFIHFLWLERLVAMAETAKRCAAEATATAERMKQDVRRLEEATRADVMAELVNQRERITARIAQAEYEVDALERQFSATVRIIVELRERLTRYTEAKSVRDAMLSAQASERRIVTAVTAELATIEQRFKLDMQSARQAKQQQLAMVAEAKALVPVGPFVDPDDALASATAAEEAYDEAIRRRDALATKLSETTRLNRQILAAADVPCGGPVKFPTCKFLVDAEAAYRAHSGTSEEEIRMDLQRATVGVDRALAAHRAATKRASDARLAFQRREEVGRLQDLAADTAARLVETEARLKDQAEIDRAAAMARDAAAAKALARIDDRLAEADAILAADAAVADELAQVEAARSTVVERITALQQAVARDEVWLEQNEAKRVELAALADELAVLQERLVSVQEIVRVQTFLHKALHRDGLPTLEIATAAPAISSLTTDLLEHSGFGTRFRVTVTTLVPTADGKGWKEDFSIRIFDNERQKEILDVGDLSGGERVLVEEALRAALTIYVSTRHQHPIRTCWRDETTGPLNRENRERYIAMLRRLRVLGGYEHILYVSHADDAVESADTIFDVAAGVATRRMTH